MGFLKGAAAFADSLVGKTAGEALGLTANKTYGAIRTGVGSVGLAAKNFGEVTHQGIGRLESSLKSTVLPDFRNKTGLTDFAPGKDIAGAGFLAGR